MKIMMNTRGEKEMTKKEIKVVKRYGFALILYLLIGAISFPLIVIYPKFLDVFQFLTIMFTTGSAIFLIYVKESIIGERWRKLGVWSKVIWWIAFLANLTMSVSNFFRLYL